MMDTHRSPEAMARALCSYITDDTRVLSEVRSEFGSYCQIGPIRKIRESKQRMDESFSRGRDAPGADEKGWDWRGDHYRAEMEAASQAFVLALKSERSTMQNFLQKLASMPGDGAVNGCPLSNGGLE